MLFDTYSMNGCISTNSKASLPLVPSPVQVLCVAAVLVSQVLAMYGSAGSKEPAAAAFLARPLARVTAHRCKMRESMMGSRSSFESRRPLNGSKCVPDQRRYGVAVPVRLAKRAMRCHAAILAAPGGCLLVSYLGTAASADSTCTVTDSFLRMSDSKSTHTYSS